MLTTCSSDDTNFTCVFVNFLKGWLPEHFTLCLYLASCPCWSGLLRTTSDLNYWSPRRDSGGSLSPPCTQTTWPAGVLEWTGPSCALPVDREGLQSSDNCGPLPFTMRLPAHSSAAQNPGYSSARSAGGHRASSPTTLCPELTSLANAQNQGCWWQPRGEEGVEGPWCTRGTVPGRTHRRVHGAGPESVPSTHHAQDPKA